MFRLRSFALAAGLATLFLDASASAGSDITVAAIATGRLYVIGTTEHPHTSVILDDRFRTESDDNGKFQYEIVYYPTKCIVAASIEGATYEAVVSNCGQDMVPGTWLEPSSAVEPSAFLKGLLNAEAERSATAFCKFKSPEHFQNPFTVRSPISEKPVFTSGDWVKIFAQADLASMSFNRASDTKSPTEFSRVVPSSTSEVAAQTTTLMPGSSAR